jgi:hypothetical protein
MKEEKGEVSPFIVYYTLSIKIQEDEDYKSIILANNKEHCKEVLLKKLNRDFILCEICNIKSYLINKKNYRGRRLSDKEWDTIISLGYPNGRGRLFKFKKTDSFKHKTTKNRDVEGKFKKGFTPWNKNLKLQIIKKDSNGKFACARDSKGRFSKGNEPIVVGAKCTTEE